jgi:hypothetical protein
MSKKEEFECNICKYDFSIAEIGILASFDNSCSSLTDMFCYCKKCMIIRLEILLIEMRFPAIKFKDYAYMNRVIPVNYRYHQHHDEVMLILKAINSNKKTPL